MKHIEKLANILLFLGIGVGAVAIYRVRFDPASQFLVLIMIVAFYVLWGVVYHTLRRDFKRKVMFEYLLVGAIGLAGGLLVFLS